MHLTFYRGLAHCSNPTRRIAQPAHPRRLSPSLRMSPAPSQCCSSSTCARHAARTFVRRCAHVRPATGDVGSHRRLRRRLHPGRSPGRPHHVGHPVRNLRRWSSRHASSATASNTRSRICLRQAGEDARHQPGQLPAAPSLGCRSGADAPDRRAASGVSLCWEPDAERSAGRWSRGRPAPRLDVDEEDGDHGALPPSKHVKACAGPQGLPVPATERGGDAANKV
jgi:hypothetical protein